MLGYEITVRSRKAKFLQVAFIATAATSRWGFAN